jgi:small-conductance mechanosensitive channel
MDQIFNPTVLQGYAEQAWTWILANVFSTSSLIELGAIGVAALLAWLLAGPLRRLFTQLQSRHAEFSVVRTLWQVSGVVAFPVLWLGFQWAAIYTAEALDLRRGLLVITASLLAAWIVIHLAASFVRDPLWRRVIATVAWILASLNIVGLLDEVDGLLDGIGTDFGTTRISALIVIKAVMALVVLLWFASILSNIFESRVRSSASLTPSVQVLFTKLFKIALMVVVVLAAMSLVGIDISAFAVFGGAIGVGIGFGLQKIVSNLISGLILLADKSIKPGDVIAVADYYGRVDSLGARYVSVLTRDGIEYLIPNEELIINRVENWSHSHDLYRIRLPVGVHYKSDVPRAIELCLEAANETPRVLAEPKSVCLLRGFGDSSVDLELRFWINDPMNGRANVCSQILLGIWKRFHENGIEIPYPQRDLHLRTPYVESLKDVADVFATKPIAQ